LVYHGFFAVVMAVVIVWLFMACWKCWWVIHLTNSFAISIRKGTDRIKPTRVACRVCLRLIIILLAEFTGWVVRVTTVGVQGQEVLVASEVTSLRLDLLCF
jgi:cellobiose-specific phosphotransferase system component IIC